MNFKKRVNGSWTDTPHYIHNTSTDTITTLPADLYADGTNATVGLKGNMSQASGVSPTTPIQPQGTGDKTANLLNTANATNGYLSADGSMTTPHANLYTTDYIAIPTGATKITQSYNLGDPMLSPAMCFYDSSKAYISGEAFQRATAKTFEVPSGAVYFRTCYRTTFEWCMVNEGSTALPFEPFGVKIPISSANTTTPVYLGEVETTRKVKKIKASDITWIDGSATGYNFYRGNLTIPKLAGGGISTLLSNKYRSVETRNNLSDGDMAPYNITTVETIVVRDDRYSSAADWLSANGDTEIWYVLAEPTTGIVNEPLMRIGDYADTLGNISIPVTAGGDTLSVDTTVQPSEVTVNYKGWHPVQSVHVYPDSSWMPTSWEEFRKAVRSGKAQSLYPVGTKLYENWGDTTSDAWIVVDYPTGENYLDSDLAQQGYTNRVMLMEEKLNYLRQFDAIEAWLYVETAIPAGTYRFTIPNYDASYGGNKTYIFTSTANVPVGGQFTLTWAYQQNPSAVQAYSSATSTSALFNVSITEWDGITACTDLGTIKLAQNDPDSTYGKLNHIHRARYGSNNYYQSGLRQWLNADATANNWWSPSNIFDRPYDNRNTAGRLNALNSNMKAVLATPTVNCITNNLFEYPSLDGTTFSLQTAYTVKDKLFLVTHTETNLSSTPNVDSVLAYYTNAQNADRIKYRKDNGNAYYWWLRTPYPAIASSVRYVVTSGALSNSLAYNTRGSAAACIIQ